MKKKKYDLIKTFKVVITKQLTTSPAFIVGNTADCRYTSQRGDFNLSSIGYYPIQKGSFGFAYQSCIQTVDRRKFGESLHKEAEKHILREREKQVKGNSNIEAYPMTVKECFPGPDPQPKKSKLLKSLGKDLYPDFSYAKLPGVMYDIVQERSKLIKDIKNKSPYYPDILKEIHGSGVFYSTLVRISRRGRWYAIHVVRFYNYAKPECPEQDRFNCIKMLIDQVYKVQLLYKNPVDDEIDWLQISEEDRLNQGITE